MHPILDTFRDDDQRNRVCRTLLAAGGLERFSATKGGLTDEARALAVAGAATLPEEERVVLLAAWSLWSGEPSALRFDELFGLGDGEPLLKLAVAALYGPDAIDGWLARPTLVEGYVTGDEREVHATAARLYDEARAVFAEGGDDPMNMACAPDACALGALRMADYLLMGGNEPIEDNEERQDTATQIVVRMFETLATISHARAEGREI